jgi:allophanate hydrolase subunit 2
VPLSGAADLAALRLANRLVGNPEAAAAVEVTLLGPELRFDRDAVVALAGAVFPGVAWGRAVRVAAGETLALGHAVAGCRGVLAIAGGVAVEPVLGSRSTFVPARLGGLCGLPLAAGDVIPIGADGGGPPPSPDRQPTPPHAGAATILRTIPGADFAACGDALWAAAHRTSSRSDRMGVRLEGPPLGGDRPDGWLASVAVLPGTFDPVGHLDATVGAQLLELRDEAVELRTLTRRRIEVADLLEPQHKFKHVLDRRLLPER